MDIPYDRYLGCFQFFAITNTCPITNNSGYPWINIKNVNEYVYLYYKFLEVKLWSQGLCINNTDIIAELYHLYPVF